MWSVTQNRHVLLEMCHRNYTVVWCKVEKHSSMKYVYIGHARHTHTHTHTHPHPHTHTHTHILLVPVFVFIVPAWQSVGIIVFLTTQANCRSFTETVEPLSWSLKMNALNALPICKQYSSELIRRTLFLVVDSEKRVLFSGRWLSQTGVVSWSLTQPNGCCFLVAKAVL